MRWIRPSNNTGMKNYGADPLRYFMCPVQYLYYFSSISVVCTGSGPKSHRSCQNYACSEISQINYICSSQPETHKGFEFLYKRNLVPRAFSFYTTVVS